MCVHGHIDKCMYFVFHDIEKDEMAVVGNRAQNFIRLIPAVSLSVWREFQK